MINDKYLCPNCYSSYDEKTHLPRKLPDCPHSLCTSCIKKLIKTNNEFICPLDSTVSKNIFSLKDFKIDNFLIDESKNYNINNNNNISFSKNLNINEAIKCYRTSQCNPSIITVIPISSNSNLNCYQKKTIPLKKKSLNSVNHVPLCKIHSLPLNIICRDDLEKICSQCALDNIHLSHKIISENDYNNYLNDLVKIYNDLENHEKLNLIEDFENKKVIFVKLEKKFTEYITEIQKIKKEIIKNIEFQCQKLMNFLILRKSEIFSKYHFTKYDTNTLKVSTSNWIKLVKEKLSEADCGTLEEPNIDSLKLLDRNPNKDIFNLVNSGQQINERYNFIKETELIINQLELFLSDGIILTNNFNEINNLIDTQFLNISDNNNNLNKHLFTISENSELIESLKLSNSNVFFNENSNGILDFESEMENENLNDYNKISTEDFTNKKLKYNFHRKLIETGRSIHNYSNSIQNNNNTEENELINGTFNYNTFIDNEKMDSYNRKENNNRKNRFSSKNEDVFSPILKAAKLSKKSINNIFAQNDDEKSENKKSIKKIIVKFINKKDLAGFYKKNVNTLNINRFPISNTPNCSDYFHQYKNNYTEPSKSTISNEKKNSTADHFFRKYKSTDKMKIKLKNLVNGAQINNNNKKGKLARCISLENKLVIQKPPKDYSGKVFLTSPNSNRTNTNSNTNTITISTSNKNNNIYNNNFNNNHKTDTCNSINSTRYKIDKKTLIKTLPDENLEKYVIYQLKKYKPNFNRINMNGIGIKMLCSHFIKNKKRKYYELKLQGSNLDDNDFNMIIKCLIDNKINIPTLNFSENNLTDDCYYYINELIKEYKELKSLTLTNNLFTKIIKEKIKNFCRLNQNSLKSISNICL